MGYSYVDRRPFVFTEEGQVMFLKIRDRAKELIALAGACRCDKLIAVTSGEVWNMLACIDRLVELGELAEVTTAGAGQDRIYSSREEK